MIQSVSKSVIGIKVKLMQFSLPETVSLHFVQGLFSNAWGMLHIDWTQMSQRTSNNEQTLHVITRMTDIFAPVMQNLFYSFREEVWGKCLKLSFHPVITWALRLLQQMCCGSSVHGHCCVSKPECVPHCCPILIYIHYHSVVQELRKENILCVPTYYQEGFSLKLHGLQLPFPIEVACFHCTDAPFNNSENWWSPLDLAL